MARYLLSVMVCLAGAQLGGSLQCYVCLTPTPADLCMTSQNCTEEQKWCLSTVYGPTPSGFPFFGARLVMRNCVEKCQPTNPNSLGATHPTSCCQEDNCNTRSGARRMPTGSWPIPAILLAAFFTLKDS
ncbi:ly6/PLAUR domain-containing protein 2-like [Mantella aurantiaca]